MSEDRDVLQLWQACYSGNIDLVQELIDNDVDYTHRDRTGETVLHIAARSNNAEVLNLLLDHLDPDVCNHNNQTPLHLAAGKGHIKVVNVLLLADCNLNRKTKYSEMTALHLACQHNWPQVVSALLEGGAVCNVTDTIGKPPEFYATDPSIHKLFSDHFQQCTHRPDEEKAPPSITATPVKVSNTEDNNIGETTQQGQKETTQSNTTKKQWQTAVQNQKKIKINHGLGFSDEHKRRMEMNVFDRLLGKK